MDTRIGTLPGEIMAISNYQPSLVITELFQTGGAYPARDGGDAELTMGMIRSFAGDSAWSGSVAADGQLFAISGNTDLFSLVGTYYGGNGTHNFAAPSLAGQATLGLGQRGGEVYSLAEERGSPTVELDQDNLPATAGGSSEPGTNFEPTLTINYLVCIDPVSAGTGDFAGAIVKFAGNFTPQGYAPCFGQLMWAASYPDLFALFGNRYGGDGVNTFRLPDLQGRIAVGAGSDAEVGAQYTPPSIDITIDQSVMPTNMGGGGAPIDNRQASLSVYYIINIEGGADPDGAAAGAHDAYLGEIVMFAGLAADIPDGWVICDGGVLNAVDYPDLFDLLGTMYGDDGAGTFRLPDFSGRTAVGAGTAEGEEYEVGDVLGSETFTLTSADFGDLDIEGTTGNDSFIGGDGNDTITGIAGKDTIDGGAGADSLDGGADDDTLLGGAGNDTLIGGAGADSLFGGGGDDVFVIGAISDLTNDTIVGGANDTVSGDSLRLVQAGTYDFSGRSITGVETISPMTNAAGWDITLADTMANSAANQTITIKAGVLLTNGITVSGWNLHSAHMVVDGFLLEGNDYITGGFLADTISTGAGDDTIIAIGGNDYIDGGSGADLLAGGDGSDTIIGGTGNDSLIGHGGDDSISGGDGNDTIDAGEEDDWIDGGDGDDEITFGTGSDTVDAGDGDDVIIAFSSGHISSGDSIDGGEGTDTLALLLHGYNGDFDISGAGAIFYNIERLEIRDNNGGASLVMSGSQFSDGLIDPVVITRVGVTLGFLGITIVDAHDVDASDWIISGGDTIRLDFRGTTGSDTIVGSNYLSYIDGKGGHDAIFGGSNRDTIIAYAGDSISSGAGSDIVEVASAAALVGTTIDAGPGDTDILQMKGGGVYDFTLRTGITGFDTLQLMHDADAQQTVILTDALVEGANGRDRIDITFGGARSFELTIDGSGLTAGHGFYVNLNGWTSHDNTLLGGAGDDAITGGSGDDSIEGGGGDDYLDGAGGKDTIDGGSGNDTIYIGPTTVIEAGSIYDGGDGADTLLFDLDGTHIDVSDAGAAFLNIEKITVTTDGSNRVIFMTSSQFGNGLISNNLILNVEPPSTTGYITFAIDVVGNFSAAGWTINSGSAGILFDITGTTSANVITTSTNRDYIDGKGGGDTITAGDGDDHIYAYAGDSIDAGGGNDVVAVASAAALVGTTLSGGAGQDSLTLGGGGTYDFSGRTGITGFDVVTLNSDTTQQTLVLTDELVNGANGFGDGRLQINFNGTRNFAYLIDASQLTSGHAINVTGGGWSNKNNTVKGGAGDDNISGDAGADSLLGGAGADNLMGWGGADYLSGGAGADTFSAYTRLELAGDTIEGGDDGSLDTLFLAEGGTYDLTGTSISGIEVIRLDASGSGWNLSIGDELVASAEDSRLYVAANASGATMSSGIQIDASGLSATSALYLTEGKFGGNDVIVSGAGDDSLLGGAGADLLNSGDGDDTVSGGEGNDTIAFGTGTDSVAGDNGDDSFSIRPGQVDATDTIDGGAGVDTLTVYFASDATIIDLSGAGAVFHNIEQFHLNLWGAGNRLVLSSDQFGSGLLSTSLTVTARDSMMTSSGSYAVEVHGIDDTFSAAGFVLGNDTLGGLLPRLYLYGNGADGLSITGSAHDDVIDAGGGMSVTLSGGNGNDTISGWGRTSDLDGGAGDDVFTTLSGGRLRDSSIKGGAGTDTLRLDGNGTNLLSDADLISGIEVIALNSAQALYSVVLKGGMAATAENHTVEVKSLVTTGYAATISAFAFGAGEKLVMTGTGFNGGDTVYGGAGDDQISTGLGGDSVIAGGGNDTIDGGEGNDIINGGDGDDAIVLEGDWLDYTISFDAGVYTIIDGRSGHSGTDTVSDVEFVTFDGGTVAIDAVFNEGPAGVDDVSGNPAIVEGGNTTTTGTVLANDTDANLATAGLADALSVTKFRMGTEAAGGTLTTTAGTQLKGVYGWLTLRADGTYTYVLDTNDPQTKALGSGTAIDVFTYEVSDRHGATDIAQLSVSIDGVNDAPVITSNGGGATATITVNENRTALTTVAATDSDGTARYSISGTDAAKFTIDETTGVLTFRTAPNYSAPTDSNRDNVYLVTVRASDGTLFDTQALSITVADVNSAPVITSNGGGSSAAIAINENATAVTTVVVSDDGPRKTFTLSGADAALFTISTTGVLKFKAAPDFETAKDSGKNNVYNVTVKVSDGTLTDTQSLAITVKDINGNTITGTSGANTIDTTHKISGKGATAEEDKINGGAGNDTINASSGNDTLIGGAGKDLLTGGAGKDQFLFNAKLGTSNIDTVRDFAHNEDLIVLERDIFSKISGQLDAGEFYAKAGATKGHDSSDRIVYDTKTGNLYYDADGSGRIAAVHFATLSTKPTLDHGDFIIV